MVRGSDRVWAAGWAGDGGWAAAASGCGRHQVAGWAAERICPLPQDTAECNCHKARKWIQVGGGSARGWGVAKHSAGRRPPLAPGLRLQLLTRPFIFLCFPPGLSPPQDDSSPEYLEKAEGRLKDEEVGGYNRVALAGVPVRLPAVPRWPPPPAPAAAPRPARGCVLP